MLFGLFWRVKIGVKIKCMSITIDYHLDIHVTFFLIFGSVIEEQYTFGAKKIAHLNIILMENPYFIN